MSKTIKIDIFDKKSIHKAIKELRDHEKELIKKCRIFTERVSELGLDILNNKMQVLNIPEEIKASAKLKKGGYITNGYQCMLVVDNENAIFWEFGTGVIGNKAPHPEATENGWVYDINEHGDKGWWYSNGEENNWSWESKIPGLYHTRGIPAQRFMFDTKLELNRSFSQIKQIFEEVFR